MQGTCVQRPNRAQFFYTVYRVYTQYNRHKSEFPDNILDEQHEYTSVSPIMGIYEQFHIYMLNKMGEQHAISSNVLFDLLLK
jgi:hypothetical protein